MHKGDKRIYADQLTQGLRTAIRDGDAGLSDVPALLGKIISGELWKERTIEQTGESVTFERFEDFVVTPPLEGLGATVDLIKRIVGDDQKILDMVDKVLGHRQGQRTDLLDNVQEVDRAPTGNSRQRSLRRLRKDRPDIHKRVLAGEMSASAGMIEAGYRRRTITLTLEPEAIARSLKKHLSESQQAELAALLLGMAATIPATDKSNGQFNSAGAS